MGKKKKSSCTPGNNFGFASVCSCWKTHFCQGRLPGANCQEKGGFALVNWMHWSIKYNQDLWQNPWHAGITPWWWQGRGEVAPCDGGDQPCDVGTEGRMAARSLGCCLQRTEQLWRTKLNVSAWLWVKLLWEEEHLSLVMERSQGGSTRVWTKMPTLQSGQTSLSLYVCCRWNFSLVPSDSGG